MSSKTLYAALALAFVAGTHAHVVMNFPTPYGFSTLQPNPIGADGLNFPCQAGRTAAFDATGVYNPMVVGENNLLNFTGRAVHGGGSCQLSVTYEYPPPADKSKWKVIHSYIGSCPASAVGNIDKPPAPLAEADPYGHADGVHCNSDDQTECIKSYQFQLPEGLKNGNATLAWTWFNKIGNREMYMNCAPISISGGSDDDTLFNSLPELFVANIPGECTSDIGGGVIGFPNPGDVVTLGEAITAGAEGTCPVGTTSGSSGSSASSGSHSSTSSSALSGYVASSSVAVSSSAVASSSAAASLTFSAEQNAKSSATAAASGAVATTTTIKGYTTMVTVSGHSSSVAASSISVVATSAVSSSVASALPSSTVLSTNYSTGTGNSTCGDNKVSCSSPGNIVCIGESQFGLCNIDYCAVPGALAEGTTCSNGVISKRDIAKRSNRMHRHGHGHQHSF